MNFVNKKLSKKKNIFALRELFCYIIGMEKENVALYIGSKIKDLRLQKHLTQEELGKNLGIGKSTIANYEKGYRSPKKNMIFKIAAFFAIPVDELFPPIEKSMQSADSDTLSKITATSSKLHESRQLSVLNFATDQLAEQEKEKPALSSLTGMSEVRERALYSTVALASRSFKKSSPDDLTPVEVTERVSAGFGFHYDGNEKATYYTLRTDLPRFDFATLVSGDSMEPTLHDGDVILVRQSYDTPRGGIYVVDYDGTAWVKHVHMEDDELVLHSENAKYSDRMLPIPPEDGDYWNIVGEVVDWFTPEII